MEHYINSFKAHLYDRTSNPIVGSFIFYWLLCNYKLILVLFSSYEPKEKFAMIRTLYPQETITLLKIYEIPYQTYLSNGFLIPLLLALLYILLFPFVSEQIIRISSGHQNRIKRAQQKRLLDEEEGRKLEDDYINIEKKYYQQLTENKKLKKEMDKHVQEETNKIKTALVNKQQELDSLNKDFKTKEKQTKNLLERNQALETTIKESSNYEKKNLELLKEIDSNKLIIANLEKRIKDLETPISEKHSKETFELLEILKAIGSHSGINLNDLEIKFKNFGPLKIKHYLHRLTEKNYISYSNATYKYIISPQGTDYLHKNEMI